MMEVNEKQFIAGFNNGYLLAEYEPQILNSILQNIKPDNSYVFGLTFGQKEYDFRKDQNHLDEFELLRQKNRDEKQSERN
jgi:hypothetical protein